MFDIFELANMDMQTTNVQMKWLKELDTDAFFERIVRQYFLVLGGKFTMDSSLLPALREIRAR